MNKTFSMTLLSLSLAFATVGCDVEQTREGELPDVDVNVEGDPGQLPGYDVDAPEVDMKMEETQVEVPDVDITTEEKTIKTPDIDVDLPADE
ncbi:hypothetical protein LOC71_07125 [Rhodopirellula sp. JC740]|uniref:Secreted protein n=1 Tax=Rhodopirellula halodulae TaxID=2894198 RepID=A0ABS8NER8_9BACT|nr:hypothetical protein [Rhodopirellula sp. JC740]MCC9642042.1 hypothetical protein [Rhodopirellula sp. JC740]